MQIISKLSPQKFENLSKEGINICITMMLFYKDIDRKTDATKRNVGLSDLNHKQIVFQNRKPNDNACI